MFYKEFMFNYIPSNEGIIIAIIDRDMTNFIDEGREAGEFILSHTKGFIKVSHEEYLNPYDYLENGLFKGIIPPELIIQSIEEWNDVQEKAERKHKERMNYLLNNKWNDDVFKDMYYNQKLTLENVLRLINDCNRIKNFRGITPFYTIEDYKEYLIKYWGDWKVE